MKIVYFKGYESSWFKYSFDEQMGNIGSEVSRMSSAFKIKDKKRASDCYKYASELIYLTSIDPRRKNKTKEIKRVREDLLVAFNDYDKNKCLLDNLNKYLYNFAYRCRANR